MKLSEMNDEQIRHVARKADRIAELMMHEAAKDQGIRKDDLYPTLYLFVLRDLISDLA